MYYQNLKLYVLLITPFIAVGILFLPVIPTWESAKILLSIVSCLLTFICGFLLFLNQQIFRKIRPVIILNLLFSSLILLRLLSLMFRFDTPSVETLTYKDYNKTVYLYNYTCPLPDNNTECGTYSGKIKLAIPFTPFVSTSFDCRCLFGTPERVNDWVKIPLEANQDTTVSSIKIHLKTGEIIKK